MLPRFSFRIPQCERGLEALCSYHTVRETSTGIARDEPCHDWSSHACDSLRVIAECEAAHLLRNAGSTPNAYRRPVEVITGFRGHDRVYRGGEESILDRFFGTICRNAGRLWHNRLKNALFPSGVPSL